MGLKLEDGLGRGFQASVDNEGHLTVDAITLSEIAHQSDAHGLGIVVTSTYVTTVANQEIFAFKNEADEDFHVDEFILGSSGINQFTVFEVTANTAGGTTITPQNLNLISGVTKASSALGNGDVTGSITGNTLGVFRVPAHEAIVFDYKDALILGTGDQIAVSVLITAVSCEITMLGFWDV